MYKVGDKIVIKRSRIPLSIKEKSNKLTYCEVGEIFTITDIIPDIIDDDDRLHCSNSRGSTYVFDNEIESMRKYKLKRVLGL